MLIFVNDQLHTLAKMKPLNFSVVLCEQFLLHLVCLKLKLYYVNTDTERYLRLGFGYWGWVWGNGHSPSAEKKFFEKAFFDFWHILKVIYNKFNWPEKINIGCLSHLLNCNFAIRHIVMDLRPGLSLGLALALTLT